MIFNRAGVKYAQKNCRYPYSVEVTDIEGMKEVIAFDHVCANYTNNYRSKDNFIEADVIPMDIDNSGSDNPVMWMTQERIIETFKDYEFILVPSRNHMKEKDGKSARPKWHIYFRIIKTNSADTYESLKKRLQKMYPFFDPDALGAARFIYATESDEIYWNKGSMTIDQLFGDEDFDSVREGSRNSSLSRKAASILKRYGDTDEARDLFLKANDECVPPLEKEELRTIWRSAIKFYNEKVLTDPAYVPPEKYGDNEWDDPIPFEEYVMPPFPVDALPKPISDYVLAVSESTQTPLDMAGVLALPAIAVCIQGKYSIAGKADWIEPLNIYALEVAQPSERKSAVIKLMCNAICLYEIEYNRVHAATVEKNKSRLRMLQKQQKSIEDRIAMGKATMDELENVTEEIASFKEINPLQLYVDDVTTEKLVSILAKNDGHAAIISSEGGIFDTLAGIYTKTVNIDVMLKAYSGDTIKVDRVGRDSEYVLNPALTVMLMAQPSVASQVLGNKNFQGRGLTARFLYCIPSSRLGERNINSKTVPEDVKARYETLITNMLDDPYGNKIITLSDAARELFYQFSMNLEADLLKEYTEFSAWVGKLGGTTLRIAGLLCRAEKYVCHDFCEQYEGDQVDEDVPLVVSKATMSRAIRLANYFLVHARVAFSAMPEEQIREQAKVILDKIREKKLERFTRRDMMRYCSRFKRTEVIQPILNFLDDYGYIRQEPVTVKYYGRPPLPSYLVNPKV